ncbi:unnamed protein product [Rhizophagus irregularis]|nr:unnamed protein product [Rhizophagus irregularis]
MAISVISKNVKDAKNGCVRTRIDSTHRLIWSITASVLIFGFGYIGFGFSFWCWIGIGFTLDRCRLWLLHGTLDRQMLASILGCWIDVGFDSFMLDRYRFDSLTLGYQIYISFDSLALDRYWLHWIG